MSGFDCLVLVLEGFKKKKSQKRKEKEKEGEEKEKQALLNRFFSQLSRMRLLMSFVSTMSCLSFSYSNYSSSFSR